MHHSVQNYSALQETHENDEEGGGVLVHVAEPSRARWNHIEDLDSFFTRIYQYHQRHGFCCMLVFEILELIQFLFVVFLTCYVTYGINYPVLFKDAPSPNNSTKITLSDVIFPVGTCVSNFNAWTWFALVIALIVWILKLIRSVYHLFYFWDIKQFFNTALKIDDRDLENMTWNEIQARAISVQIEQQMCIHKRELTELDIHSRILRQTNYIVAMVNKKLLPPRLNIPFVGEVIYWTGGLKLNIHLLFFWSPWSPFEQPWQLREEYKKPSLRHELAHQLGKQILWLALANLIFAPIIFMWQLLYAFFSYVAIIRKEPSILAKRRWSPYGRLYMRHFNELEHQLTVRLARALRPATKYLSSFSSPMGSIICENLGFYSAALLGIFCALSIWDEDVLTVEHVLTIITALSVAVAILRTLTPNEDEDIYNLEELLNKVMFQTHYMPADWVGQAHTARVRAEFEQYLQYGFANLLETILSPILTPYILWRHVYPRSIEIVDFFRNFTISVVGVGDVCSFAQMDVRRHGNPEWHEEEVTVPDQYSQAEDGKVELSLIHFQCTNPSWKPPESVRAFVKNVQNQSSMIGSLSNQDPLLNHLDDSLSIPGGVWRIGEPCAPEAIPQVDVPLYSSMWRNRSVDPHHVFTSRMWSNEGVSPAIIREMALNATYLHSLHSNRTENRVRNTAQETTPLLLNR